MQFVSIYIYLKHNNVQKMIVGFFCGQATWGVFLERKSDDIWQDSLLQFLINPIIVFNLFY